MSLCWVSADGVWPRIVELINDPSIDLMRVKPPVFDIWPPVLKKTYKMSHWRQKEILEEKAVFPPRIMWLVDRPDFVIDESLLPY